MKKRTFLIVLFCLIVIGSIGYGKYNIIINPSRAFEIEQEENTEGTTQSHLDKNIVNIVLLGVDSNEARESNSMGYRSDSMILVSLNLDNKNISMLSIPRDSYTEVPGNNNKDKINHAMAFGGGPRKKGNEYAIESVENLLGININYYITVDMDAVKTIVETIDGVSVNVERSMGSGSSSIQEGLQTLNGEQAITYLSNRNARNGDFARITQQQNFMLSLFKQTRERGKFSDIPSLYIKVQNKIFTNLKIEQIGSLALFLKDVQPENIQTYTLKGKGIYVDGIYYLDIDQNYLKDIVDNHFSPTGM